MTVKETIDFLSTLDGNMELRVTYVHDNKKKVPLQEDFFYKYSDTAYIDDNAPEEEWDNEDGKVCLGDGEPYLLIHSAVY